MTPKQAIKLLAVHARRDRGIGRELNVLAHDMHCFYPGSAIDGGTTDTAILTHLLLESRPGSDVKAAVQALINRIESGGLLRHNATYRGFSPAFFYQVKILWDLGFGRVLGYETFDAYADSIPRPSLQYFGQVEKGRRPVGKPQATLVDMRVPRKIGMMATCALLGMNFQRLNDGTQNHIAEIALDPDLPEVYWMGVYDNLYAHFQVSEWLETAEQCDWNVLGCSPFEGCMFHIQSNPDVRYRSLMPRASEDRLFPGCVFAIDMENEREGTRPGLFVMQEGRFEKTTEHRILCRSTRLKTWE